MRTNLSTQPEHRIHHLIAVPTIDLPLLWLGAEILSLGPPLGYRLW